MENFRFTQGKWEVGGNTGDGVLISSFHPDYKYRDIATVWIYNYDFLEQQEANANAKLISKAPEMLDMLNKCAFEFAQYKSEYGQGSELESKIIKLITEIKGL